MADSEAVVESFDELATSEIDTESDDLESELARFAPVISNIDFNRLRQRATALRESIIRSGRSPEEHSTTSADVISCSIVQPPFPSSYHVLYEIQFSIGERWLLNVPATGHQAKWDESAAGALRSEALIMQMLSDQISISLPKVYEFNDELESAIGCLYILMEYVTGLNGQDAWFDASLSTDQLEIRKKRMLHDVARAMVQLGKCTSLTAGAPVYREDCNSCDIVEFGPRRVVDADASLRKMQSNDSDDSPIYRKMGPFDNARDFLLDLLRHRQPPANDFIQGIFKAFTLLIESLPLPDESHPFVLTPWQSCNAIPVHDGC